MQIPAPASTIPAATMASSTASTTSSCRESHPGQARLQAGRTFFAALDAHIRQGASFVVESTLAGQGFVRIMKGLQEGDYTVVLAFLFLPSPEVCIERVAERVRKGGHDVPEEDIVRRYYRSKYNFWHVYRPLADEWQLYYNADDGFQGVATGKKENYVVSDGTLFNVFMHDINDESDPASP